MAKVSNIHTERVFEDELTEHLAASGWTVRTHLKNATGYSRELALFPDDLVTFIKETQPAEWAKFCKWHNGDAEKMLLKRVAEQLDKWGTLHLIRNGFKDKDAKFFLCQLRPANRKNPQLVEWYRKNRLTAIRQLHYSVHNENSIDLVYFLNGLPVATSELKTDTTQNIADAILQYRTDRLPKNLKTKEPEPLLQFKTRALVHFAVSTDEVFMTTKLAGAETSFLPFNLGNPDGLGGATKGNPPAPKGVGYPTWYFWHQVLQRDCWLAILGSFLHLEKRDIEVNGKKDTTESLIFPRYHQLQGVLKLIEAAAAEGVGHSYLIQHSAGSGKSNTIAWTAHWLANLHGADDAKIFSSVIVITDRRVLDRQLQETISQFEHKAGVVQKIDENSQQLADALNEGVPIIVTTLQKFPFVLNKIGKLEDRRYALIVDEAHSSQTGSAAQKLNQALASEGKSFDLDGEEFELKSDLEIEKDGATSEDVINTIVAGRKRPGNVSYFAFTATPKAKTLQLFGRSGADGLPEPFHVYSMRQAIDEGFILDVLKHYVSYRVFYKLGTAADKKLVPMHKATKALVRFANLHPYNIAQKVVVIVEHFRGHVMAKIGGRAKAMVVTAGRREAVRYKLAMDKYIKDSGYKDLRTLVAFSGEIADPESGPDPFSESNMNPQLKGAEPAEAFKDDEYRVLLVANKYQTGFDQPLLHTMYVDKRLSGVMAVQTLSRLNRTFPGKEDTFILDFVNDPEEIRNSFLPYFRTAQLESETDPNIVHDLQVKLDQAGVYFADEIEGFAKVFFSKTGTQAGMHAFLKPAADRFDKLEEEEANQFRKDLGTFLRMYDFLSQIVAYNDPDLEKRYAFGKNLMPRIAARGPSSLLDLNSEVRLTHYRLQKQGEHKIDLESGAVTKLKAASEAGSGRTLTEEEEELAEIVLKMNDLFAGDLTDADMVGYVTTIKGKLLESEKLADQATSNTEEQFAMGDFKDVLTDLIIEGQENHNAIAEQLLKDENILTVMQGLLASMVYKDFQRKSRPSSP